MQPGDRRLPYWTSCPHTHGWVIDYLNDHSETVSWNEFKRKTQWEDEASGLGYRIPNQRHVNPGGLWLHKDWSVSFHKVDPAAVDGNEIYFFVWSAMEYIFANDRGIESLLRNAKAAWGEDDEEEYGEEE